MWACSLFPFQNEYDGYMLKQIVFGSFYHPFQDGYKSSVIQILFPWLVQREYLNHLLQYFLYAKTITKCWVFCWHVFWQMHKFQIHKLVSRCDHLNISTMYSVIIQVGIFREYRNKCFWRTKCFGSGTNSVYGVADIRQEGRSSDYAVSEINWEMPFSPSVLHA